MQIKPAHLALLAALLAVGCDDPDLETPPLPVTDAALPPADMAPLRLTLVDHTSGLLEPPRGPFRLVAEDTRGQTRIERLVAERVDRWPHTAELEPLSAGTWRVTVYADRDGDGHHDSCPFPPEPSHTERPDVLDNISGTVEVRSGRVAELEVPILRRICGPGDVQTGISGRLLRPDDPTLDGVPIRAMLIPDDPPERLVERAEAEEAPRLQALRIPLFPEGAPAGASEFRVGELIPGRYRVRIFADDDGDRTPSPCGDDAPGGGDRYVAELADIEVVAGALTPFEQPIALVAAPCPDAMTGLTGEVALDLDGATPDGALRIEITSPEGGAPIASTAIAETLRSRALPHPFTISGVPPGTWRVRLYLDRDGDRRFSPCDGMPSTGGFDHVIGSVEDVVVTAGELTPLGPVSLSDADCEPSAGIAGVVEVDVEPGTLASGRPVRMHLESLDGGEPLGLQLFADHARRDGTEGRFGRRIPAGRYRARAYVDTDRSGSLGPCDADPYGDRAQSDPFDIEVAPGEVLELGLLRVVTLGCPQPSAAIAPVLQLDALTSDDVLPDTLWLDIREEGGWSTLERVDLPPGSEEISVDRIELAPGTYTVTAFVDGDGDGVLDSCDESTPDPYQARVSLTLDDSDPLGRPPLRPAPCDP